MIIIAKIGTSSITDDQGQILDAAIAKLCDDVATVRAAGHQVAIVTSGAIGAGLPPLGLGGDRRPKDAVTLQAVSAVGQSRLMQVYNDALGRHGLLAGQVLLAPLDFIVRQQYLHARGTLLRLLELGVVPVINENDAIADDEIRFGDNDRIAALVAHLVDADLLVLLTDAPGLLTADPRVDESASLIEEIVEVDHALEALAGSAGTARGSGGMASKLAAAKIASWSGVRTLIASAGREGILLAAASDAARAREATGARPSEPEPTAPLGTVFLPHDRNLPARKLWIAFAIGSSGTVVVDDGAKRALLAGGNSLLAAGVVEVRGSFDAEDAVEIATADGTVFAKGLSRAPAAEVRAVAGKRSADLPDGTPAWVIHRDDLVVLD